MECELSNHLGWLNGIKTYFSHVGSDKKLFISFVSSSFVECGKRICMASFEWTLATQFCHFGSTRHICWNVSENLNEDNYVGSPPDDYKRQQKISQYNRESNSQINEEVQFIMKIEYTQKRKAKKRNSKHLLINSIFPFHFQLVYIFSFACRFLLGSTSMTTTVNCLNFIVCLPFIANDQHKSGIMKKFPIESE